MYKPNPLPLTNGESTHLNQAQNQNQEIVVGPNQASDIVASVTTRPMDIESIYGIMVRQVRDLGQFCKSAWSTVNTRISSLEGRNATLEEAVTALISKDDETTKIVNDQFAFMESSVQAYNYLRTSVDQSMQSVFDNIKKISDWTTTNHKEVEYLKDIYKDIRNRSIDSELALDKVNKLEKCRDSTEQSINSLKSQ